MTFKIIAESGSIRKAANVVGIAQPALTRSMKALESAVGVELFKRSVRGVKLTREGELLLEYAESVIKNAEDVSVRLRATEADVSGVLAIGTFSSISIYLWPRILSHLQKVLPRLQIRLKTREDDHIGNLANGTLDLVVDAEPRPRANMVSLTLYKDRFNFFAHPKKLRDRSVFIFSLGSYDEDNRTILDHLREHGIMKPSCPYEIDSFETAKALAIKGIGIGVLPERVADDAVCAGLLKRFSVDGFPASGFGSHKICATLREEDRKDRRISAAIREMRAALAREL